mgnify:CR=1 FL=1
MDCGEGGKERLQLDENVHLVLWYPVFCFSQFWIDVRVFMRTFFHVSW